MRIIAGKYKGRRLEQPDPIITRPTMDRTREAVFSILGHHIFFSHARVLDAFAGSGAYGFEALSRGAGHVYCVEQHPKACAVIKNNAQILGCASDVSVLCQDVLKMAQVTQPVDLIFMDPPYQKNLVPPALKYLLQRGWIGAKTVIVVEVERGETLDLSNDGFVITLNRPYGRNNIYIVKATMLLPTTAL